MFSSLHSWSVVYLNTYCVVMKVLVTEGVMDYAPSCVDGDGDFGGGGGDGNGGGGVYLGLRGLGFLCWRVIRGREMWNRVKEGERV